jgi:hypothetical protein
MSTNDPSEERLQAQIKMEKAQAKRDAADKRSSDITQARQTAVEIDAAKTARLRTQ